MTKTNKILSSIFAILLLIAIVAAGKDSVTDEGKIKSYQRAKNNSVSVFLDDELIEFSNTPVVKHDKVYVPVSEFTQKIGAKSEFKISNKIIIEKDDKNLVINTKDHTAITEDNKNFFISSLDKGRKTLLPLDIIANHFGFNVSDLIKDTIKVYSSSEKIEDTEGKTDDKKEVNKEANNKEVDKEENKDNTDKEENKNLEMINQNKDSENNEEEKVENKETQEDKKKIAYLTFDDGPNVNTPKILDVLKEKDVKATFFMLGSSIISHGDITKRISEEDHGLGVHSMTHNFKSVYAHPYSFLNEMNRTNDALFEATGRKTLLLRAPYGSKPYMKQEYRDLVTSWGYRIWDWNVDSRDSIRKNTTPEEVFEQVSKQVMSKDEAIILFHDKEHTLKALPKIIDYLIENGFEIKKIDKKMTPINFWHDAR